MTGTLTFTMIKPDAVAGGHSGAILKQIEEAGFEIVALKLTHLSDAQASQFYAIHAERPFFKTLVEFMSSGKIIAAVLKKTNAVADFRTLIGNTNPEKADAGTVRKLYAKSIEFNAIHGSDSDENAMIEAGFFFSNFERFN
ncbi:MAG: nucleoside diphosphate kinase [Cytophagaceae bacterium]|jgi:nucleoside-diphosphate kinase|nr:nucleoside diphosphate kinase [Cytophagaceae bacterium]